MKFLFLLFFLLTVASSAQAEKRVHHHPIRGIQDQYIVLLDDTMNRDDVERVASQLARKYSLHVRSTWPYVRGFLCSAPLSSVERLLTEDIVTSVEQDLKGRAPNVSAPPSTSFNGQNLWFLDRIDDQYGLDGSYHMCPTGAGGIAYVIDYAAWGSHEQFVENEQSRVTQVMDCTTADGGCVVDTTSACATYYDHTAFSEQGHGTAVAGVLTGRDLGASRANVISVKVYACGQNHYLLSSFSRPSIGSGRTNT